MTRLQELIEAAEAGNQSARHLLANVYSNGADADEMGEDVEKDVNKAVYWLEKAAADGYEMAMLTLGSFYMSTYYGIYDLEKSQYWYSLAKANGSPYADRFLKKIESMKEEKK